MTFIKRKKNFFPVLPCVIVIYTYPKVPGTLHPLHPRFFFSFSFVFVFSFYFWVITRPHISVTMLCIREKQNHLFFLENFAFFAQVNRRYRLIFWLYKEIGRVSIYFVFLIKTLKRESYLCRVLRYLKIKLGDSFTGHLSL